MVLLWIKILLIALAVAGLGYMIYSMVKGSGPPSKPPSDCAHQKGSSANADSGCGNTNISLGCCPADKPKCCSLPDGSKKCYDPTKSACTKTGVCPISNVCPPSATGDKATCCGIGKNKGNNKCDPTSGTCIACGTSNPACGGKIGSTDGKTTPPSCCDPKSDCYAKGESPTNNPCVCCNQDPNRPGYDPANGVSTCCSKNRCKKLPTGGQICCPLGQELDELGECCGPPDHVLIGGPGGKCCKIDEVCYSNGTLTCCSGQQCAEPSVCYSETSFPHIKNTALEGMCAGPPGVSTAHSGKFCVNQTDESLSTFTDCKSGPCASAESCMTLSYYPLPSGDKPIGACASGTDAAGNLTAVCIGGPNNGLSCLKNGVVDSSICGTLTNPTKCTADSQCPSLGNGTSKCWDPIKKASVSRTSTGVCPTGTYSMGTCATGCPSDKPTSYCDSNLDRCLVYQTDKGEQGFCAPKVGSSPKTTAPLYTYGGAKLIKGPFKNQSDCKKWCEGVYGGRCVGAGSDGFSCELRYCSDTDPEIPTLSGWTNPHYLVESDDKLKRQVEFDSLSDSSFGPGYCYAGILAGDPSASQLEYSVGANGGNATCTASYVCNDSSSGVLMDQKEFNEPKMYKWGGGINAKGSPIYPPVDPTKSCSEQKASPTKGVGRPCAAISRSDILATLSSATNPSAPSENPNIYDYSPNQCIVETTDNKKVCAFSNSEMPTSCIKHKDCETGLWGISPYHNDPIGQLWIDEKEKQQINPSWLIGDLNCELGTDSGGFTGRRTGSFCHGGQRSNQGPGSQTKVLCDTGPCGASGKCSNYTPMSPTDKKTRSCSKDSDCLMDSLTFTDTQCHRSSGKFKCGCASDEFEEAGVF